MNKNILIVEDEADIANWFKKQLELKGGFTVEIADGGKKALEMIEKNKYDLVLLDLVMPEMDGVEVLRNIRKDETKYGKPSVMALTNVTSDIAKNEMESLGVLKYIVKTDADIDEIVDEFFV